MKGRHGNGVNILDVAKKAGVSSGTASMALSGNGRVSDKTRRRINAIAQAMNYTPNLAAQMLRVRKSNRIGLLMHGGTRPNGDGLYGYTESCFLASCQTMGLEHQIERYLPDDPQAPEPSALMSSGMVGGAILIGHGTTGLRQWLTEHNDMPWLAFEDEGPMSVMSDVPEGVRQAVQHVAALGHRQVAISTGKRQYTVQRQAYDSFLEAREQYGLTMQDAWQAEFFGGTAEVMARQLEWARRILSRTPRPTAAICIGATPVTALIYAALEMGLNVPRDLSIVAYTFSHLAATILPYPTHIEPDYSVMMDCALNMLRASIEGRPVGRSNRIMVPRLVAGQTTAPVPGNDR